MTRSLAGTLFVDVVCATGARVVSAQTPSASPADYLTFDAGNGQAATLFGASGWTGALVGNSALVLPGRNGSYAEVPTPIVDTTRSFTVTAWVKLDRLGGYQTFVSEDGDILSSFFLQLRGDSGQFSFTVPYDLSHRL